MYLSKSTNIILDCKKEAIGEVLKQAQQIGMVSEDYYYLLTSLDAHTVDLEDFKVHSVTIPPTKRFMINASLQYGGTNFTAFRMIDTNKPEVKSVIRDIVSKEITQGRILNIQVNN